MHELSVDFVAVHPFPGCHTRDGLEGSEEGSLIGKARLYIDIRNLLIKMLTEDTFSMIDAIGIDILREGAPRLIVDAVGDETAVCAENCSHIL